MYNNIFLGDWERRLDLQYFIEKPFSDKAYICSPLAAESEDGFLSNMYAARIYMMYAMEKLNYLSRAPHAYLPALLCDKDPDERELALSFGLKLLEDSSFLLVCGNRLSDGMKGEIGNAFEQNKRIIVYDRTLFHMISKMKLTVCGALSVILDQSHPLMAHPAPQELLGLGGKYESPRLAKVSA